MLNKQIVEDYRKHYQMFLKKRILDVGCGKGIFLKATKNAIGFDVNNEPLRYAKKYAKKRILLANVSELPFKDNFFDVAHLEFVVEHLPNVIQSFKEIRRVLKPESFFIIITTNLLNPLVFLKSILPLKLEKIHNPFHQSYHKANTLKKLDKIMAFLGYKRIKTHMWSNREKINKKDMVFRKIIVFLYDCARLLFRGQLSTTFLAIYSSYAKQKKLEKQKKFAQPLKK